MDLFISCDWGTSNFRLRALDRENSQVLAEWKGGPGISAAYEQWRQTNKEEVTRLSFYQAILLGQIQQLSSQSGLSLDGTPLIASGMASSSLGMRELPYTGLPLDLGGHALQKAILPASDRFRHETLLVSGVRTADDVMRGEETQLIGCLPVCQAGEGVFLFPGTHSKHIRVKENKMIGFTTYMTGEFFELLSQKSILSGAVTAAGFSPEAAAFSSEEGYRKSFEQGVEDSEQTPLLQGAFRVRTNHLFSRWSREENYNYLSGLLIGEELKDLAKTQTQTPITIICTEKQKPYYSCACALLNIHVTGIMDADEALVRGHVKLFDLYRSEMEKNIQ
jgi:2-dehydro-3-deoxygalactonokinase